MSAVNRTPQRRDDPLRRLVERARSGDAGALEELVRALQDDVYGLAVRMLWRPHDAEDATQEILVKVITRLDSFRGDSALRTWAYRIAVNHLLSTRRRRMERQGWTFDAFADDLAAGLDRHGPAEPAGPAEAVLAEEVKVGCTLGMLQCLDRPQRVAYILGEVFQLPSDTAATISDTTPAAYRKRLSRARAKVRAFVAEHCGIVNPDAACRCTRRVPTAIRTGRIDPAAPTFLGHPTLAAPPPITAAVAEMEDLHDAAALFHSHPNFATPERVTRAVAQIVASRAPTLLDDR
ncbi:MAG TPA: RNA polymerase sigma factor [Acidimicrobiales bacterium]